MASQSFSDKRVRIRSVESGKDVLEIDAGDKSARVSFSPDGKTLATASTNGEIKLWNADDGTELKTLGSFSFHLLCVAFSRDGKRIVAGGGLYGRMGGQSTRVDSARAPESSTPESPTSEPATRQHLGWAGVWEIGSGSQIAEMKDMPDAILGIAISPDGKLVQPPVATAWPGCGRRKRGTLSLRFPGMGPRWNGSTSRRTEGRSSAAATTIRPSSGASIPARSWQRCRSTAAP